MSEHGTGEHIIMRMSFSGLLLYPVIYITQVPDSGISQSLDDTGENFKGKGCLHMCCCFGQSVGTWQDIWGY